MFFFKNKSFDFESYIANELGYVRQINNMTYIEYKKDRYTIIIYKKEGNGYKNLLINFDDFNLATLRFIPNSKIMVDMILSCIKNEVDKNEEI
jgi:hypothetical protein